MKKRRKPKIPRAPSVLLNVFVIILGGLREVRLGGGFGDMFGRFLRLCWEVFRLCFGHVLE